MVAGWLDRSIVAGERGRARRDGGDARGNLGRTCRSCRSLASFARGRDARATGDGNDPIETRLLGRTRVGDGDARDERDGDGDGDERGDGSKAVDVVREGDARGGVVDGERDDAGARRRGVGRRVRVGPGDVRRVRTRARCELGDGARGDGVRADDRVDASRARVDEVRVARARDGGRVRGAGGDGGGGERRANGRVDGDARGDSFGVGHARVRGERALGESRRCVALVGVVGFGEWTTNDGRAGRVSSARARGRGKRRRVRESRRRRPRTGHRRASCAQLVGFPHARVRRRRFARRSTRGTGARRRRHLGALQYALQRDASTVARSTSARDHRDAGVSRQTSAHGFGFQLG